MTDDPTTALRALASLEPGSPRLWSLLDASGLMQVIERAVRAAASRWAPANRFRDHGRPDRTAFVAELLATVLLRYAEGRLVKMARMHSPDALAPLLYTTTVRECRSTLFPRFGDDVRLVTTGDPPVEAVVPPARGLTERVEAMLGDAEVSVWRRRMQAPGAGPDLEARMAEWAHCKLAAEFGVMSFDELTALFGRSESTLRQRFSRANRRLYLEMARQLAEPGTPGEIALDGVRRARIHGGLSGDDAALLAFWTGAADILEGPELAELCGQARWRPFGAVSTANVYAHQGIEQPRALGRAARAASFRLSRAYTSILGALT